MQTSIKILSAGAVKRGVARIAADFERDGAARVATEFVPVPELRRRIAAGEAADVIVATPAAMDDFAQQGRIEAATRAFVGRSRMGVVVHADAAVPALDDTQDFVALLLSASAVVRNEASSGLYSAKLFDKLGLASQLASRIVVVKTGAAIMACVADHGPGAVGLAQISEVMVMIDKGCRVQLAGPLPAAIQNETSYEAAAVSAGGARTAARMLVQSLTSAAAKEVFAATGID
jgi:molybdate transport system substrate-binding protein